MIESASLSSRKRLEEVSLAAWAVESQDILVHGALKLEVGHGYVRVE